MTDIAKLKELRERVIAATGPDRELDAEFWLLATNRDEMTVREIRFAAQNGAAAYLDQRQNSIGGLSWRYCSSGSKPDPYFGVSPVTRSIDAAHALLGRVLPGWWRKSGTCCVSDDACIGPDFNSPIHGERLKAQFFPLVAGSEFDAGFDVDRRPPGNEPLAILEALLSALIAQAERAGA